MMPNHAPFSGRVWWISAGIAFLILLLIIVYVFAMIVHTLNQGVIV